jgi:hypothetical protein
MFHKLILTLLLVTTTSIIHSEETCESMSALGANYASAAFQLTTDDFNAIDQMGFFDAYLMYLSLLFEKSESERLHSTEFFLVSKVAGAAMKKEKDKLVKTLPPEGFKQLFPRMVVRSCEIIKTNPR